MSRPLDPRRGRRLAAAFAAAVLLTAAGCTGGEQTAAGPWGGARLVQPAALAAQLADTAVAPPLLLHVGVRVLYRAGAIPGSRYVGPGSDASGIRTMLAAVEGEPRDRDIVIYCGCCPWQNCPNMKPTFAALQRAGFTNVKALMIERDLERDWADLGYPIEKPAN